MNLYQRTICDSCHARKTSVPPPGACPISGGRSAPAIQGGRGITLVRVLPPPLDKLHVTRKIGHTACLVITIGWIVELIEGPHTQEIVDICIGWGRGGSR